MALKILNYQALMRDEGRIDVLIGRLLDFSRSRVRGLMDHDGVTINGEPCADYGKLVVVDDQLTLKYDPGRKYREKPQERNPQGFRLLFKDEYLVIVNKEAGVLTVPTDRREKNTLVDLLSHHLGGGQSRSPRVSVVHRLDRETSGVLVFGRRQAIADHLVRQFAGRKPEREYYAIVAGKLGQDRGEIRSHLLTDKALNQKSAAGGELAITHYRVIKRLRDTTLVAVNLETGRRNQIRVHFAEMGHPVLGDGRYESERASHPAWPYKRLALHARLLGFEHPIIRRHMAFEAELPLEFSRFIDSNS